MAAKGARPLGGRGVDHEGTKGEPGRECRLQSVFSFPRPKLTPRRRTDDDCSAGSSVPGMPSDEESARDIRDAYLLPKDATVPSLVVECGRADEEAAMLADMRNWFRKGDGKVKKVILMVWVMKPSWVIGGRIEVYEFDNQKFEEKLVQEWVRDSGQENITARVISANHLVCRSFCPRAHDHDHNRSR